MKVQISIVGMPSGHRGGVPWPQGWPPPATGDNIAVDGQLLTVKSVTWYPEGDRDGDSPLVPPPLVYVVAGP